MDKKNHVLFVDLKQASSIMSNTTFNQGKKFNAYTEAQVDRTYFFNINYLIEKLGLDEATKLLKGATSD